MFAPICVSPADSGPATTTIYPCRSLCMTVKQSCESKILAYNYPWPSQFDCSRFPDENGLCIPPGQQYEQKSFISSTKIKMTTTTAPSKAIISTATKTTVSTIVAVTKKLKISTALRDLLDLNVDDKTCYGCQNDEFSMAKIVKLYCNADIGLFILI